MYGHICVPTCTCIYICMYVHMCVSVFLISFLFGTAQFSHGTVNYDYIVTNSINCLLIGSMAHTITIVEPFVHTCT